MVTSKDIFLARMKYKLENGKYISIGKISGKKIHSLHITFPTYTKLRATTWLDIIYEDEDLGLAFIMKGGFAPEIRGRH